MKIIYALTDPSNSLVRYIGETVNAETRLAAHCSARTSTPVAMWVRRLAERGTRPVMIELESVPKGRHREAERFWIGYFRFLGSDLLNLKENGYTCEWVTIQRSTSDEYPQYSGKQLRIYGQTVSVLRIQAGLSRSDLASMTNMTPHWVKVLESDYVTTTLYRVCKLATALGVTVDDLAPKVINRYW